MRKSYFVAVLALAVAIFVAAPAHAQDQTAQQQTVSTSALSPDAIAKAAQQTVQAETAPDLDKRIAAAHRDISIGKKMLVVGTGLFVTGIAGVGNACANSPGLSLKYCSTKEKVFTFVGAGGGLAMIGGTIRWIRGTHNLHRAEEQRRHLTMVVTPTTVMASFQW